MLFVHDRYEAERMCNGLERTRVLAIDQPVAEGYFPKLSAANSGIIWGSRQEGTRMSVSCTHTFLFYARHFLKRDSEFKV